MAFPKTCATASSCSSARCSPFPLFSSRSRADILPTTTASGRSPLVQKCLKSAYMIVAMLSLAAGNLPMEAAAVFLISTQGALFGPSKYGLLPELLRKEDFSWGNGVIELGTFLAAITATMAAGFLAVAFRGRQIWSGAILLGCTWWDLLRVLAFRACLQPIPRARSAQIHSPISADNFASSRAIVSSAGPSSVTPICGFWPRCCNLSLSFTGTTFCAWTKQISYLQAAVGIGIGVGSLAAGYLSRGKIEYGLIPMGALGMTVFGFLVSRHRTGYLARAHRPCATRILWRILRGSAQCTDSTSPGA